MVLSLPSWRPPRRAALAAALGGLAGLAVAAEGGEAFAALPSGPAPRVVLGGAGAGAALGAASAGSRRAAAVPCLVAATLGAAAAVLGKLGRRPPQRGAPQSARRQRVALAAFENELGVQDPVGFWDPAGLADDGDVMKFRRRRSVEIKHGRLSMLATMGYITPEILGKLPGYISPSENLKFADIPNGLAAILKVPAFGWVQIIAWTAFVEMSAGFEDYKSGTPGDYEWKILTSSDPSTKQRKLNVEIANGRLAMVAIVGMFFQDGLTGSAWGDWALYTGSPLRAFEGELGVRAPPGRWDQLGLSEDGGAEAFRRMTEIKHGPVSASAAPRHGGGPES